MVPLAKSCDLTRFQVSLPIVILAAAGVSSALALNNQLLLTPRSTPADWGEGTSRLSALREGRIQITAGFSAEVDIQMTAGAQNETVTVSAERPVLDTTSTTVSMSAGARTVGDETPATRTMLRSRPP